MEKQASNERIIEVGIVFDNIRYGYREGRGVWWDEENNEK